MSAENDSLVIIDCKDEGWDNVLYDTGWFSRCADYVPVADRVSPAARR